MTALSFSSLFHHFPDPNFITTRKRAPIYPPSTGTIKNKSTLEEEKEEQEREGGVKDQGMRPHNAPLLPLRPTLADSTPSPITPTWTSQLSPPLHSPSVCPAHFFANRPSYLHLGPGRAMEQSFPRRSLEFGGRRHLPTHRPTRNWCLADPHTGILLLGMYPMYDNEP